MSGPKDQAACPFPFSDHSVITLAHGGGGKLTAQLIDSIFRPAFGTTERDCQHDCATLTVGGTRLAFTTDTYVISPLRFPGGDIGRLAVIGTSNDLAMSGARAAYLSCGFILEEGLSTELLSELVGSMRKAADECGVRIVTGDTKVVERGKGDGIFINTTGIGVIETDLAVDPGSIREGDAILLSGDIGRHGTAILSVRQGLQFETTLASDCAPLFPMVDRLLREGIAIRCLRDLTRGGLGTALVELAGSSRLSFGVREEDIPVSEEVRGASEILGLDPLFSANEGRMIAFVPEEQAERCRSILRSFEIGARAAIIGRVSADPGSQGRVIMRSSFGTERFVDRLSGDQLPRIC